MDLKVNIIIMIIKNVKIVILFYILYVKVYYSNTNHIILTYFKYINKY